MLPFDLTYAAKQLLYHESLLIIVEESEFCHVCELNEFYNIINHQVFSVRDGSVGQKQQGDFMKYTGEIIEIFDTVIMDDQVYIASQLGLTSFDIYDESLSTPFSDVAQQERIKLLPIPDVHNI